MSTTNIDACRKQFSCLCWSGGKNTFISQNAAAIATEAAQVDYGIIFFTINQMNTLLRNFSIFSS